MKFTQQLWSQFYFENLLRAITGRSNTLFIFFLFFLAFSFFGFSYSKNFKIAYCIGNAIFEVP